MPSAKPLTPAVRAMFDSIAAGVVAAIARLDANTINGMFIVAVVVLFGIALVLSALGRAPAFCRGMPTLLTTLGILGTFLGIAIGLLHFDVARIEFSIPVLLDGLKLAFISSIVGIVLSVCLRFVLMFEHDTLTPRAPGGDAARRLQLSAAHLAATQQLAERVTEFGERLTATMQEQHRELLITLDGFARQLSDMSSRQLIAALEQVIRDFNTKLGEQFGDNFRRLDASVAKLLQWQEQYRLYLEQLGDQLERAVASVAQSEHTLQSLTEQALRISHHVADQEAMLAQLRRETLELEALLGVIAELRDKAKEAFPALDRRLTVLLETIEQAIVTAQHFDSRRAAAPRTAESARGAPS